MKVRTLVARLLGGAITPKNDWRLYAGNAVAPLRRKSGGAITPKTKWLLYAGNSQNLRALGVHLTQGQLLPFARAAQLIEDLHGIAVSPGTLVSWVGEARSALDGTAILIADHLIKAPLLHADESGLRVASKLHWLHVAASETHTWYGVHARRGMEAMQAHGILPKRLGVLVHDCWAPYWQLDCIHALCNAHLLRELVYVQEATGQVWPQRMKDFLLNANDLCQTARDKRITLSTEDIAAFGSHYYAILCEGERLNPEVAKPAGKRGRAKQSIAFNLLRRLRQHADAVLLFIRDPAVPFTNNLGERAVRMPKVKQKISGCFRTLDGAENFCVIRSCLDTLRKQGHGMLDVLRRAFADDPIQPAT
ncbi:IS66 family transposase [Caballeronia sordidicola]|nr:IS66 family transposase [Caballeronia sordidicola]